MNQALTIQEPAKYPNGLLEDVPFTQSVEERGSYHVLKVTFDHPPTMQADETLSLTYTLSDDGLHAEKVEKVLTL